MYTIEGNLLKTDNFSLSIQNIDSVSETIPWYGIIIGIISGTSMILFFIVLYNKGFDEAKVFIPFWFIGAFIVELSSQLTIKSSGKKYKINAFGMKNVDNLESFKTLIEEKISKN